MRIGLTPCAWLLLWTILRSAPAADPDLRETLPRKWQAERTAIVTGQLRFKFMLLAGGYLNPVTPDELAATLKKVDLVARPKDIKVLYESLCPKPSVSDSPWATVELVLDGDRRREELRMEGPGGHERVMTSMYDGEYKVEADTANQQLTVYRGKSRRADLGIHDVRFVPPIKELDAKTYQIVAQPGGLALILAGASEALVDPATGFVHRAVMRAPGGQVVLEEIRQYGPTHYACGAVLPSASARARYSAGRLKRLTVAVMEDVQLNADVPDNAFVVAAKKGAVLVDATENRQSPRVSRLDNASADVIGAIHGERAEPPASSRLLPVLLGIIATGILVGAFVWRWRRSRVAVRAIQ